MKLNVWLTHPEVACFNFSDGHRRQLAARLPGVEIRLAENEQRFVAGLPQTDVAVVWRFEQAWLERAVQLKWIITPAAGRDYFSLIPPPGLDVEYSSFHGPLIAETVLGMLLAHCRGLFVAERLRTRSPWPRREVSGAMRSLRGARLTILGFGAIGRTIGRAAQPLGVQITGVARRRGERPEYFAAHDELATLAELDTVLRRTDYLILALPATPETDRLLDARRIDLLPSHAALVNIGRGNAVDETALAAALTAGRLAGAYLDVYAHEPLPESSPLRRAPNVLVLPHVSACAPEYLDLFIDELAVKFKRRYGTAGGR